MFRRPPGFLRQKLLSAIYIYLGGKMANVVLEMLEMVSLLFGMSTDVLVFKVHAFTNDYIF